MGDESIHGEFGLLFLQARWQNCFGIPEKGAECKFKDSPTLLKRALAYLKEPPAKKLGIGDTEVEREGR
jgi:hypothetical protein